jgi:hypothetical protein
VSESFRCCCYGERRRSLVADSKCETCEVRVKVMLKAACVRSVCAANVYSVCIDVLACLPTL